MPKLPEDDIRLGKLELQIMNAVWDRHRATVQDVVDTFAGGFRKPAYNTILTMMRKLEAKGYLAHDAEGRTYVYRPVLQKREARAACWVRWWTGCSTARRPSWSTAWSRKAASARRSWPRSGRSWAEEASDMTSWTNAEDALLQYAWVASIAAAALPAAGWLLVRLGRVRSEVYRHMVWSWCLAGITVVPPLWLYAPKVTLAVLPAGPEAFESPAAPTVVPVSASPPAHPLGLDRLHAPYAAAPAAQPPLSLPADGPAIPWRTVLAILWASGVTFMLLRLAAGAWQLRRIRHHAEPAAPSAEMAGGEPVRLLLSDAVTGPVCFGLLRPAILLPRHMYRQAGPHELRMILRHELAHIHRRDAWANLLQRLLEAALFFHPGVWLASWQLTQQRELICDNWVLEDGAAPGDYCADPGGGGRGRSGAAAAGGGPV